MILIFNDNSVVKLSTVWTTAPLKPLWSQIQSLRLLSVCPLIISILQLCCFNLIFFSGQKHDWMWKNPGKLLLITPGRYVFFLTSIEIDRDYVFFVRDRLIFLASEMPFLGIFFKGNFLWPFFRHFFDELFAEPVPNLEVFWAEPVKNTP